METQITLQLLGLIRFACNSCRKSFAVKNDGKISPSAPAAPSPS